MPDTSPWIVETTDAGFGRDVIERSHELPVVVDFWAAWCTPCRMLAPLLEKLAADAQGTFLLVKAELERCPVAASQFAVSSIPAVFGLRGGRIIDQFLGLMSEEQLRAWLTGLEPSPSERLQAEAASLAATDPAAAEARLRQAIHLAPAEAVPQIELARLLLDQDRLAEGEEILERLAERGFLEPEAEKLKAHMILRRAAPAGSTLEELRARAAQAPDDRQAQWQLAQAQAGRGEYAEALDRCLRLVQTNRHGLGEQARELMVNMFHVMGPDHELTAEYRRKLSTALY